MTRDPESGGFRSSCGLVVFHRVGALRLEAGNCRSRLRASPAVRPVSMWGADRCEDGGNQVFAA